MPEMGGVHERLALETTDPWWTVHVSRYRFAQAYARGARVLDIACGTGYGLGILREGGARCVVGADVDREAVRCAQREAETKGHVVLASGTRLPFADASFELVTSFETLEHIEERETFIAELSRVLAPTGLAILSTPNALHTLPVDGKPRNPFHVYEYAPDELQKALSREFASVQLMGQALDPSFTIPPFWDEQQRLPISMRHHLVLWRTLRRLPHQVANAISRMAWGHPLLPTESDFRFLENGVDAAPVIVALCRRESETKP